MCPNYNLIPALIFGFVLYKLGQWLSGKVTARRYRWMLGVVFFLLCLPALSFVLFYSHIFGEPLWYLQFRSIDFIEVLSAMWGLFFGFVLANKPEKNVINYRWRIVCFLLIFTPFAKSYLLPPEIIRGPMTDNWENGVCLQTTPTTCGPAALATIFKSYDINITESEIAHGSYSMLTGTEIWYMIRFARHHGMQVSINYEPAINQVVAPAILGTVSVKKAGHFITLLRREGEKFIIGDPMIGRRELTEIEFNKAYGFNGFAVSFTRQ
jgi:hypothetical protein